MVPWGRVVPCQKTVGPSAQVGEGLLGYVEFHLVGVAPGPALPRLEGRHDRVARLVEMLGGVAARRAVATADVAAAQTEPQVDPGLAHLQTLLAPPRAGRDRFETGRVWALH